MQVDRQRLTHALSSRWPDADMAPLPAARELRLELDSRRLMAGDIFVALPGVSADGRDFVESALAAGVATVLYHLDDGESPPPDPRVLGLPGLKAQLGALGRELFGVPDQLQLIGVTGTNGKSSVTHYIAELSEALGRTCGVIGTLGNGRVGRLADGGLTTPGPLALQASLAEIAGQDVTRVAMEVSSHALDQGRLAGCRVAAGVFTNLSRDHLDYHPSMAAYAAAKAQLFKRDELELAVVNADDPLARLMLAGISEHVRVLACGEDEATTLRVVEWLPHATGQRALIATPLGERVLALGLMGRFNLDNVLLAIATLYGLGDDLDALLAAAESLAPVPGRMQRLTAPGGPSVVIDYAHTPDALDNALRALRAHLGETATLWCLFGCGGDRDPGKRPLMGKVAEVHAGRIVITDDNPRGEAPATIRAAIRAGLAAPDADGVWEIDGRREAIARTLAAAEPEDIVLIAGKGHETYQEVAGVRHAFSDLAEAEAGLARRSVGT
ncbi:UDP-N-acetylmuramoyl-L-alanyl-D-glutamate--2,6-diaminopimelate ligase [Halomonas sp. 1513]|nr:UDP-N-acetylmuramoyl-L-alanyl-D-glutamate--2,6-diaminopimelate ligase [Halomonas sp. 1513]APX93629.1 UDP-N-acetylmuramoyl-L-alanyl-D-glutamate--2,6-diaminopimelate ligase [Halomonas sp. 1513]